MSDDRQEHWDTLGLEPGASPAQVRRAYQRRRALYDPDSLATYSLLSDDERLVVLERLEAAYQLALAEACDSDGSADEDGDGSVEAVAVEDERATPDRDRDPGALLRFLRVESGLALEQVSEVTKIRAAIIDCIEREDFSRLPAAVYIRGFVIQYARLLGVPDPERLAAAYLERMRAETAEV